MVDFAELNLKIDPGPAVVADTALDRMAETARRVELSVNRMGEELRTINQRLGEVTTSSDRLTKEQAELTARLDRTSSRSASAGRAVSNLRRETDRYAPSASRAARSTRDLNTEAERGVNPITRYVQQLGLLGSAFIAFRAARNTVGVLRDYETALVGVTKTTGLTGDALADFESEIISLSQTIPIGTTKLLEIGTVAGQLGVSGSDDLEKFIDTLARLEVATNVVGEQGALELARLIGVSGEDVNSIDALGSALTRLGNESKASEAEIVKLGLEVAKGQAVYNVAAADALAYGAALAGTGQNAQLAGSALGRTSRAIDAALREGGVALETLEQITQSTAASFSELFETDTDRALSLFLRGLGRLERQGLSSEVALSKLNLAGDEILKTIPVLATRYEDVARALELVDDELRTQSALTTESEAAFNTLDSRLQIFSNNVSAAVLSGRDFTDVLSDWADTGTDAVNVLFGLTGPMDDVSTAGRVLAGAIGAVAGGLTGLATAAAIRAVGPFLASLAVQTAATAASFGVGAAAVDLFAVSLAALRGALISTGIGAVAVLAGSLIGAFIGMSDATREATNSFDEFEQRARAAEIALERFQTSIIGIDKLRALRDRAEDAGDFGDAASKARAEAERLKDTLAGVDVGLSFDEGGLLEELRGVQTIDADKLVELLGLSSEDLQPAIDRSFGLLRFGININESLDRRELEQELARELEGLGDVANQLFDLGATDGFAGIDEQLLAEQLADRIAPEEAIALVQDRIDFLEQESKRLAELDATQREEAEGIFGSGGRRRKGPEQAALEQLRAINLELETQAAAIGKSAAEREIAVQIAKAEQLATKAATDEAKELASAIERNIRLLREREAQSEVDSFISELQQEIELLKTPIELRDEALAIQRLQNIAIAEGIELVGGEVDLVKKLVEERKKLLDAENRSSESSQGPGRPDFRAEQEDRLRDQFARNQADLALELELLGKSNEEKELARFITEQYALALQAEREGHDQVAEAIRNAVPEMSALYRELQRLTRLEDAAQGIGRSFSDAFGEVLRGTADAKEALEAFAVDITNILTQKLVLDPLADQVGNLAFDILSSINLNFGGGGSTGPGVPATGSAPTAQSTVPIPAFARGGAFPGGAGSSAVGLSPGAAAALAVAGMKFAAQGMVLGGPTLLQTPGGAGVIAGERNPEFIMPAAVLPDGSLGVRAMGGQRGGDTYHINLGTPRPGRAGRADSLRSARQVAAEIGRIQNVG